MIRFHARLPLCILLAGGLSAQSSLDLGKPGLDRSPLARLNPETRQAVESALRDRSYREAERLLANALAIAPDARVYAFLGGVFFLDRDYLNAGIALKKSDVLSPLAESERFTLAMCYVILKMPDKAKGELQRLAALSPSEPKYVYWLARLDYDAQRFSAAVEGFRAVLKLDASNVRAHDNLGLAYEALGRNDEAIASYRTASALNQAQTPCSPWPAYNLGALLRKLGHLEDARVAVRESLRCSPEFARAHYQFGLLLEKEERYEDAIRSLQQAAAKDAAYPEPHYALGRILRRQGDAAAAARERAEFERLKSLQKQGEGTARAAPSP